MANVIADYMSKSNEVFMQKIAKFEKVSYEQFKKDFMNTLGGWFLVYIDELPFSFNDPDSSAVETKIREIYDKIKIPERATSGSAGYDFFAPFKIHLEPNKTIKMPTGIRVKIDDGWVLQCYPRSGLGFKYRMQLDNTVGIIDSDYYNSDNEGHIMAKLTNDGNEGKTIDIEEGKGYMQGIFVPYGITEDDDATGIRNGGFGSTTK